MVLRSNIDVRNKVEDMNDDRLKELYAKYGDIFPHLLIIPSLVGFSSMWVSARDLGGIMGLEVRQRLLGARGH